MEFKDLVLKRESVRKYTDKKIKREDLELMASAGLAAPSACNSQPWTFIAVDDDELVQGIAKTTHNGVVKFNKFTLNAKAFIVIVMEKSNISALVGSKTTNLEYGFIDLGIAAENICLQATDLGIGTCILGYFNEKKVQELLNIDKNRRVGLLISVGYSANENPRQKTRKDYSDACKFNSYK